MTRVWRPSTAALVIVVFASLSGCLAEGTVPTTSPAAADVLDALAGRAVHTATTLADGSLIVAGGCVIDGCGTATDSVYKLNPNGAGSAIAPMSTPRAGHVALLLADQQSVFVAGGFVGEGEAPLASSEILGPSQDWELAGEMELGRGGNAVALLGNGRPIVIGGWLGPRRYTATTEIFDPRTSTFSPGPELPEAADGLAAITMADGTVLATGGQVAAEVATGAAVLISADGSSAKAVGPLLEPRFKHTMVLLPSGDALIIGGTSDDRQLLSSTELFDPATGSFRPGPTMVHGRYKLGGSAVVLPDGRVAVGGGGVGVEVMDPEELTSSSVAAFGSGVASFATMSILGDDLVNIGGYDSRIRLTRMFETLSVADLTG